MSKFEMESDKEVDSYKTVKKIIAENYRKLLR